MDLATGVLGRVSTRRGVDSPLPIGGEKIKEEEEEEEEEEEGKGAKRRVPTI